jgi:DHA1 family bicyclomycin/chloramphenicol resistance-like MFS transporter
MSTVQRPGGWLMANLVSQLAFSLFVMSICIPSMQDWPTTFGASQAAVQLTFSGFVAAFGGMQLVYGALSDRYGRRPVLVAGLALACAGSLVAALAPNLGVLTLGRVLQGAGVASGMVTARAMVQDLFAGPERTRMMAFVGMAMGLCPPLGTVVGGQLHVYVGWQANFWLVTVMSVLLLVAARWGLPAPGVRAAKPAGGMHQALEGYARLLHERAFLLSVVLLATMTAAFYTFLAGAPVVLKAYGVTPERLGWYVMLIPLSYIVGNVFTTRLIRSHGDRFIMRTGQVATLAGTGIVVLLGLAGMRSPLGVALPLVLLGIGHGLLAPVVLTRTVGLIPALAGSAAAMAGVMQQVTGAFGGLLIGLVPDPGQLSMGWLMLGWTLVGLFAHWALFAPAPAVAGRPGL